VSLGGVEAMGGAEGWLLLVQLLGEMWGERENVT
jgi:hypothetical protein